MQENDAKQKNLEAALGQAQSNTVNAFNEMVNRLNSSPQDRAQSFVNDQNMLVNEMNAKIAFERNAADYIDADIMMNNGRIGWKTSDKDAAEDLANKAKGRRIRSAGEAIRHFLKNCESLALSLVVKCAQYFHRTGYPSDIDLNFLNKTAFTGNAKEIAKQHHFEQHDGVNGGTPVIMAIKMGHFATDEVEIDSGVDFSHQMIFKYQLFKGDHFDLILLRGKIL